MTKLQDLQSAADRHFKAQGHPASPSTFEAIRAAASVNRAKANRLRQARMSREDQSAAIRLSDLSRSAT